MEAYLTKPIVEYSGTVEVSEDFELPEYQAEVRRTAGVRCAVTRDNAFLEEGRAEVSGSVLYTVVYLAGEGGMASVPLYSGWQTGIPLPADAGLGVEDLYITAEAENVTCRITGPRKLTMSARVKVKCCALGRMDCSMETGEGASAPVCRATQSGVLSMKTLRHTGSAAGETAGDGTVITCQGAVRIGEVRQTGEGLAVTGEAVVRMLVLGENGSYMPIRCRAPIADTLPMQNGGRTKSGDGGREACSASGVCASLSVTTSQDGRIRWEMEYDLEAVVLAEETAERAVDGYSLTHEDTPHMRQAEAVTGGRCVRCQVTLNGEKTLPTEEVGELSCIYGWGSGRFEKGERLPGGRYLLTGTALCTLFLTGNGDLVTEEVTLPIRCEWDPGTMVMEGTDDFRCRFAVGDVTGHMDGNLLRLQAEAYGEGLLFRRESCVWLQRLEEHGDRPLPQVKPSLVLYTPEPGEDAWAVRKRYRCEDVTEAGGRFVVRR